MTTLDLAQRSGGVRRLPGVLPRARARAPVVGPGGRLAQLPRAVAERGVRAVLRGALRAASARRRASSPASCGRCAAGRMDAVRPGAGLPRLPARPHPGRQPRLPRARLQQGRGGAAHAAAAGRRRGVLPRRCGASTATSRFQKVGTEDFRAAMEAEAGRPLERFFERWIYGSTLPRLKFSYRVERQPDVVAARRADRRGLRRAGHGDAAVRRPARPADVVVPVTERVVEHARPARRRRSGASRSARTTARSPSSSGLT